MIIHVPCQLEETQKEGIPDHAEADLEGSISVGDDDDGARCSEDGDDLDEIHVASMRIESLWLMTIRHWR